MLGLGSDLEPAPVDPETFDAFLRNRDPRTGEKLTAARGKRRAAVDFTFSPPKSVSLAAILGGDERIIDAVREAVRETMATIEADVMARVRVDGQNTDRTTGNW